MKQEIFIILVAMAFAFAGCSTKTAKTVIAVNTDGIFSIDISMSYPHKEIRLQSIAEIEYVALETTNNVLLDEGFRLTSLSDKYIVGWQNKTHEVFIFNRNGKIAAKINQFGQSGAEYSSMEHILFDEKNEEVFVAERSEVGRIQVYTLKGEYKRTLNYSKTYSDIKLHNFDDETLLIYVDDQRSSMLRLFLSSSGQTSNVSPDVLQFVDPERPYMLMSKKDGTITNELNIVIPERYALSYVGEGSLRQWRLPNNRYHGQDFVISDMSSDTIYKLTKNKELTPLFVRKPPLSTSKPLVLWSSIFMTDNFSVILRATKNESSRDAATAVYIDTLMLNLNTGEINTVVFVNDDLPSARWSATIGVQLDQINVVAGLIQTPSLFSAYKEKLLKGDLEKLIATLKEDDNQIVMIVKFK